MKTRYQGHQHPAGKSQRFEMHEKNQKGKLHGGSDPSRGETANKIEFLEV